MSFFRPCSREFVKVRKQLYGHSACDLVMDRDVGPHKVLTESALNEIQQLCLNILSSMNDKCDMLVFL